MISTKRLLLRPFSVADGPKLLVMSGEDGMRRWIPDQVYRDQDHADQVVRALMSHTANPPHPRVHPYVLGIEDRETRSLIGHIGLSPARGSVEVGYAIEQRLHGNGLATEALTAVTEWAVTELGLPEILGVVEAANVPSCRVLEKAGFVRDAEEEKTVAGRSYTIVVYGFRTAAARRDAR